MGIGVLGVNMSIAPVANDTRIYASQYNALVTAIQDEDIGHAHTGAADGGKRISHADLTDGKISSLSDTHTHGEIDDHIDAVSGVHGGHSDTYIVGMLSNQMLIQVGTMTFSSRDANVLFATSGVNFTETPFVFVVADGPEIENAQYVHYCITARSSTGFSVHRGVSAPLTAQWLAIGKRSTVS